ncbi:hypothetical protein JM946_22905 [Steroidobacter sp. S1-65]|uniref:Universal stress protein n=1 Tax=Steroidobacter gossypii TaxID=2805490 RepID=A0ABS1X305_9GAMM|nr:hypothetical protein [Steroidobacter gossypii]MBM0107602.1 hypothetical protein [Steroidobacter gossypii]
MRLLIGSDSGYAALIRAANEFHEADSRSPLLVLFGSDSAFPFKPRPSTILVPGMPAGVIAAIPALEEFGIASRLASPLGLPGCYDGPVTELADAWLRATDPATREGLHLAVSGPDSTISATEDLARRFGLTVTVIPAQETSA